MTTPAPKAPPALTVYYDGACPICRREIAHYQRCAEPGAVDWVDVAARVADPAADLDRAAALARLHVRTADGALASGAAAFAQIWLALPGWRWVGRVAAWPPARLLLELAYRISLRIRPLLTGRPVTAARRADR